MADGAPTPPRATPESIACRPGSSEMARVELYFGAGRSDSKAWRRFLATVVTPRFPAGLTSLDGFGQWRGPHGLTHEATHVLIIFYTPDRTSDARIEAIRLSYKVRFRQNSVLRADSTACVGF